MMKSFQIYTIPADQLDHLRSAVLTAERNYERQHDGLKCAIEVLTSDPDERGRIAFDLTVPYQCESEVDVSEIVGGLPGIEEEPCVLARKLRENPYCLTDEPFWILGHDQLFRHHVGDVIIG